MVTGITFLGAFCHTGKFIILKSTQKDWHTDMTILIKKIKPPIKGIVSRDWGGLQIVSLYRYEV
jgi:hypothetical protein